MQQPELRFQERVESTSQNTDPQGVDGTQRIAPFENATHAKDQRSPRVGTQASSVTRPEHAVVTPTGVGRA